MAFSNGTGPRRALGQNIGSLGREELVSLARAVCGQAAAYALGHGNIHPENIYLSVDGSPWLGGRADHAPGEWTTDELEYMAPELFWSGALSPASDVYSVGLLLYAGITRGRLPFFSRPAAEMTNELRAAALRRRMNGEAVPIPTIAGEKLGAVLSRALAFDAKERYADTIELSMALEPCVGEGDAAALAMFGKPERELSDVERTMAGILASYSAADADVPEPEPEPETSSFGFSDSLLSTPLPELDSELTERLEREFDYSYESTLDDIPAMPNERNTGQADDIPAATDERNPVQTDGIPATEDERNTVQTDGIPAGMDGIPAAEPDEEASEAGDKTADLFGIPPLSGEYDNIFDSADAAPDGRNPGRTDDIPATEDERNPGRTDGIPVGTDDIPTAEDERNPVQMNDIPSGGDDSGRRSPLWPVALVCVLVAAAALAMTLLLPRVYEPEPLGPATPTAGAQTSAPTPSPTPSPAPAPEPEFSVYAGDLSWTEANARCAELGGRLAVIKDSDDFARITALADAQGLDFIWVGLSRVDGALVWLDGSTEGYTVWAEGEPSVTDTDGTPEDCVLLWKTGSGWLFNDSREDPAADYPQIYSGRLGYACET